MHFNPLQSDLPNRFLSKTKLHIQYDTLTVCVCQFALGSSQVNHFQESDN